MKPEREMRYGGFWKNSRRRVDVDPVFGDGLSSKPGWKSSSLPDRNVKNQGAAPVSSSSSSSSVSNCLPIPACARYAFRKLWSELRGYASAILVRVGCYKPTTELASTNNEAKKKRKSPRDDLESIDAVKKHEREGSAESLFKVTKEKLGDRITTLQQIVSPFGKTDTASVLTETVKYIKFSQEYVQDQWGREERVDTRVVDLRSRGLCLVPVSCTLMVYRDNVHGQSSSRNVIYCNEKKRINEKINNGFV